MRRFLTLLFIPPLLFLAAFVNGAAQRDALAEKFPMRVFIDSSGRSVRLPVEIKRIITTGPVSQMFLAAAAPDLMCALSVSLTPAEKEFLPPFLAALPVVGQFYGDANFNPEEIARLAPDVIIDIGDPKPGIANDMENIFRATGTPVVHISATLHTTPQAFRILGELLNRKEKGGALANFCEKTLASAGSVMEKAGNNKRKILHCAGTRGLYVLAKGSFHSEILDWMADNQAVLDNPSSRATGNEVNPEQIMLWNPQIIIFGLKNVYDTAASDPVWRQMSAVQNGLYFYVPQSPYNWLSSPPAINRFLGILWLGNVLYPQLVNYDLYEECAEYFRLFYGHSLSRSRFTELTGLH
jgi:iron complex transport system substrate-binding protein